MSVPETEHEETLWSGSVSQWHYAGKWFCAVLLLAILIATFFVHFITDPTTVWIVRGILLAGALVLVGWIRLDRSGPQIYRDQQARLGGIWDHLEAVDRVAHPGHSQHQSLDHRHLRLGRNRSGGILLRRFGRCGCDLLEHTARGKGFVDSGSLAMQIPGSLTVIAAFADAGRNDMDKIESALLALLTFPLFARHPVLNAAENGGRGGAGGTEGRGHWSGRPMILILVGLRRHVWDGTVVLYFQRCL